MGKGQIRHFRFLASLIALSTLAVACGRQVPFSSHSALYRSPALEGSQQSRGLLAPSTQFGQFPNPVGVFNPQGPQRFNSFASGGSAIQVHFVNAYKASVAENERLSIGDADGPAQAMLRWIDGARQTLDGSFYDINDESLAGAFIRAKKRGVKVRIVTDSDNMTAKDSGPDGPPRPVIQQMKQARIPIVEDNRSAIMHNKFMIIDSRVVWTGSTNLTTSSLFHHNNNALSIQSQEMVANFQSEFERMFTQRIFSANPPRELPYPVARVGQASVATYFSPRGGGKEAVLAELQGAQKDISFMTFSLTDKAVGSLLVQRHKEGVNVTGVFDTWLGAGQYSLFNPLQQAGLKVSKDGNEALLHHKIIMVDDAVITGSYNYSDNAENNNNENFLIIKNSAYVTREFRNEFSRVHKASLSNRRVPFKPKQEDIQESKAAQ